MKHLIIIPAYNEEQALPATVASLQGLPAGYEVLIVNDGSKDNTGRIAEQLAATSTMPIRIVHLPMNGGIGVAVQTGYVYAAKAGVYQCVLQFDADGQHDAHFIPQLVGACVEQNLDMVIGSRFLDPKGSGYLSTGLRRVGIRFFAGLISTLAGVRVTDPTSGFRCAGPKAWQRFARHYPEDYPEPESLFWCARNKLRIGEVPVTMHPRQGGVSSIGPLKSFYYVVKVTLAILLDWLRRKER